VIVLPPTLPALNAAIIHRAQQDIPILEKPVGSNRSPEIDAMCRRWGVDLGSAWCALWTATVWADAGAAVPPIRPARGLHPAIAESWRRWALEESLFVSEPVLGAAALYGKDGHEPAHHIACCVVSLAPILLDLEGNTSETGFSREGELTALKRVNGERLIGYIVPRAA
jgi:hypothetical protein